MAVARKIMGFFVPGGLLLLAGVIFNQSTGILPWRALVAQAGILVVPLLGLVVGWRFNRYKPVFGILVLWLVDRLLNGSLVPAANQFFTPETIRNLLAVLLPFNLLLCALGGERGLLSISGGIRFGVIAVQPLLIHFASLNYPEFVGLLTREIVPLSIPAGVGLPQPGLFGYVLVFLVMTILQFRRRDAVNIGFIWALLASYLGLVIYTGLLSSICFSVGGLILVASIVEAAHGMAYRDELTGLPGRRALNELCLRLHGRYSVAMLDIDFFKKFNDTYGHDIGDQVLKMVASRIGRVTGGGRPFRYGGEEFTVIFPRKSAEDTVAHLEKLRKSVEFSEFAIRGADRPARKGRGRKTGGSGAGTRVGVTISIGVASRPGRKATPEDVIKRADEALYRAKKAGRNRVVC